MVTGHLRQKDVFFAALGEGRMHHAWLLAGPRGVGKRRFADMAALHLLGGRDEEGAGTTALFRAGTHLDHHILERLSDDKGKTAAAITVDQVRGLLTALRGTAVLGKWRTVVVDAVDDMNRNAANALLKALEEPSADTVFFLVSHAPGRLLPTIRSRCRTLRFQTLPDSEVKAVLAAAGVSAEALDGLVTLAAGAPGTVLGHDGVDMAALSRDIATVWGGGSTTDFARSFAAAGAVGRFEAMLLLAPRRIVMAARRTLDPRLAELEGRLREIAADAVAFHYDRVQVAMAVADVLAAAGRIEGSGKHG